MSERGERTGKGARLPVLDLGRRMASLLPEMEAAVARVAASGRVLLGPETEAFEAELAGFTGRAHAVAVSSATEALRLTMVALGIGAGDEVIVPAMTAVPTAAAVCLAGATPVFVDVDPHAAGLDWDLAAEAVTARTKAVLPVHLYGRPVEVRDLGVPVIEDAAQAIGATDPCAPSAVAVFSFYPTKNLGGIGDGGAVVTDDADLAARIRRLRTHGLEEGYRHVEIAGNARLSELEAAVLRAGLQWLPGWNERRRKITEAYRAAAPGLGWQADHERHVHHLCVLRTANREGFRSRMPFETAVHYPLALTQQPAYARFASRPCPEAEAWAAECVTIPCFPEMTDDEVDLVCSALS